jgi:DNA repair protein RadC
MKVEVFPQLDFHPPKIADAQSYVQLRSTVPFPNSATLAELADPYFQSTEHEILVLGEMNSQFVLQWIDVCTQQTQDVCIRRRTIIDYVSQANTHLVFLAHNHPSGIALPSKNDIIFTRIFQQILQRRGQILIDHLIKGADHWGSMRAMGHIR